MADTPQVCPSPAGLDLLELVRSGAYRPVRGHSEQLILPTVGGSPATVELVDPEGVPLITLPIEVVDGRAQADLSGMPRWTGRLSARPFERMYRPPAEVRAAVEQGARVFVVNRPINESEFSQVPDGSQIVLLVLASPSTSPSARTLRLLRCVHRLAMSRPGVQAVAVPMGAELSATCPDLYATVLDAYAPCGRVLLDPQTVETRSAGLVLFFTGLSGSGKSTVARAVRNVILEQYERSVTLLDGDVVRRTLSAGLGFSPEDRETNIRRIGWVAATVAHHGGIAICSPIAPYQSTRQDVLNTVIENGGQFVLIHVSTPLEICEERDRKGLYAKARAGLIPDFTGVSAPYEQPTDADLVLDTAAITIDEATESVLRLLTSRNMLKLPADRPAER